MKFRALFIICIFLLSASVSGQDYSFFVSGYVYDNETGTGLPNVNIFVDRTTLGGTTDRNGHFNIKLNNLPSLVHFSHLAYKNEQYLVRSATIKNINIRMKPFAREIKEVVVTGERIRKLFNKEPLYILDYEIWEDKFLFLANVNKNPGRSRLYLASLNGDTISSIKVNKPEELFRDCFGNIHFISADTVWQIYPENNYIWLIYPSGRISFEDNLSHIKAELDGRLYYQRYVKQGKIVYTYYIDRKYDRPVIMSTIRDSVFLALQADEARFRTMGADINMAPPLQLRQNPIHAPLFKVGDQIVIFNFINNKIEYYSKYGKLIDEKEILFHRKEKSIAIILKTYEMDPAFTRIILMDEGFGKFYALYINSGIHTLIEVNMDTGKLGKRIEIPEFAYIDRIRVHNNAVYFMYLKKIAPYYMSIYRMEI